MNCTKSNCKHQTLFFFFAPSTVTALLCLAPGRLSGINQKQANGALTPLDRSHSQSVSFQEDVQNRTLSKVLFGSVK